METYRPAPFPRNEEQRLETLHGYALLDSPNEALFDALAGLAAQICLTPISLIVLIDRDRQWFKANVGFDGLRETAREIAICAHAILSDGITEIPDMALDERFARNPFVSADLAVRFYAGVPLTVANGQTLGTLCVMDRRPRTLRPEQRDALGGIAAMVVEQFEERRAALRLIENSPAVFFEIDIASQQIRLLGDVTREKFGVSRAQAEHLALIDILPDVPASREFIRCINAMPGTDDESVTLRTRIRFGSGASHPIDLRLERSRTGRPRLLGFGLDAAEVTAANERGEMFAAAIECTRDAIMIATPRKPGTDFGTIVHVNEALLGVTGASRDELVGRPIDGFLGPQTDGVALEHLWTEMAAGRSARAHFAAHRRDGSEFSCETTARAIAGEGGATTYVVYTVRDVSDAVARGGSLELRSERLTTLTEVARNLFASLDPRALVDALVRGVAQLTGGGTAHVLARGTEAEFIATLDLLSRAEDAVANDDFLRAAAAHDGVLLSADGRRAGIPIAAPSGVVSYLIDVRAGERQFVATDAFAFGLLGQYLAVAVRNVELYGELAARRAAVIELNQVKNDLIAMLAHDFKGPLTTIVGLADVLAEDERFDAESRRFLGMINSSAMRLASLASDTLALSRLEQNELSLRFDRVDMVALLRDIVRVFSVTRTIDMRSPFETLVVRADAARLRQVFENVIGNAIKYSPRGETVDVVMRERQAGVEVAILDRGIGIPAHDLAKLFGRFARGSNARELGIGGTGFGLYLSRTIIEMHGGQITVESTLGRGSTFRVFVPTVPAPQRTLDRRVLLLDSEDDGRSFIAHTLRDEGYAVVAVADEDELLRALDEGRYDAAIVDVDRLTIAPDELLARIAHRATLVRLVSTVEAEGTGWNAALRKPFLIKDLQVVLESAVAERRRAPRSGTTEEPN